MKGRAKIELIDAKSGEVVQTVESDNLVTNAINNVYNLPTSALWYGNSRGVLNSKDNYWAGMFGSCLADKMLCGMLCFSDDVLADVNHCIPSNEEMDNIVAYASKRGNVDSSNLMRGSFDSVNSVIGSNYASLVFNWGTLEGNGVIKSVSLTSMMGGEQAYHGSQMELQKLLCNLTSGSFEAMGSLLSAQTIPDQKLFSGIQLCARSEGFSDIAPYVTQSGKYVLLSYTNLKDVRAVVWTFLKGSSKIGISTSLDRVLSLSKCEQEMHFDITSLLASGIKRFCASEYSSVYLDISYTKPNTTIRGVEFSGEDIELSSFTVVLSNVRVYSISDDWFAKLGNFLYARDYTDTALLYRINILTGVVDSIVLPSHLDTLGVFLGQLFVRTYNSNDAEKYVCYRLSNVDLSLHILSISTSNTVNAPIVSRIDPLPEPFVVTYKNGVEPHLAFVTAYLATVNNLSSPVTKTSAQAMRITYTLTDN